jgi:hypothetical protein
MPLTSIRVPYHGHDQRTSMKRKVKIYGVAVSTIDIAFDAPTVWSGTIIPAANIIAFPGDARNGA